MRRRFSPQDRIGRSAASVQHWFYVTSRHGHLHPLIWLTKGRWSPSAAKRDAAEHETGGRGIGPTHRTRSVKV